MPGGVGNTRANELLDIEFGTGSPATHYIALFTAMPTAAGGGTEAAGGGYARLAVTNNATNWPAAVSQVKTNGIAFEWTPFSVNMGTFVGAAVFTASTGGTLLRWGPFSTPREVLNGEGFTIPAGGAQFRILPGA